MLINFTKKRDPMFDFSAENQKRNKERLKQQLGAVPGRLVGGAKKAGSTFMNASRNYAARRDAQRGQTAQVAPGSARQRRGPPNPFDSSTW